MATVTVNIKHAGKVVTDLPLDTSAPPAAFKQVVYEKTGIPVDRMKVMVKGGILKVYNPRSSYLYPDNLLA